MRRLELTRHLLPLPTAETFGFSESSVDPIATAIREVETHLETMDVINLMIRRTRVDFKHVKSTNDESDE